MFASLQTAMSRSKAARERIGTYLFSCFWRENLSSNAFSSPKTAWFGDSVEYASSHFNTYTEPLTHVLIPFNLCKKQKKTKTK